MSEKLCKYCLEEGIERKAVARGMCHLHYKRWQTHGDPSVSFWKMEMHGMTGTSEHNKWKSIKKRCFNKNSKAYKEYGGRGITMCEEWKNSFSAFYKDMGDCPEGYSIERLDVNGNYEPNNCIWADKTTQSRNRRIQYNNKSGCPGVHWYERNQRWVVRISVKGKRIPLGCYKHYEDAVKARILGELEHWGYIQNKQFEYLLDDNKR